MNVKKLREKRGLSQGDMAKELGLSRTTYTKYENGVHDPSPETLNAMSNLLQVPVDYLIGNEFCSSKAFSQRLRRSREVCGASLQDAADLLGVTEEIYGAFEEGRLEPNLAMLSKLALEYRTTADYLLGAGGPTGGESRAVLTEDERRLLSLFRKAESSDRAAIRALLGKYAAELSTARQAPPPPEEVLPPRPAPAAKKPAPSLPRDSGGIRSLIRGAFGGEKPARKAPAPIQEPAAAEGESEVP